MDRACRGLAPLTIRNVPGPTLQSTPLMSEKLITDNRRARHDYHLLERHEAGMVLTGTEVKSLRQGRVTLGTAYADVRDGELWLIGAHIDEYDQGNLANHEPDRDSKLLMKCGEIDSLRQGAREKVLPLAARLNCRVAPRLVWASVEECSLKPELRGRRKQATTLMISVWVASSVSSRSSWSRT